MPKRRRAAVPRRPRKAAGLAMCKEVKAILRREPKVKEARVMWDFVCQEKYRERLRELAHGCLYIPTNRHVRTLFDKVEHMNPWGILQMFEDSFFPENGTCPTEVRRKRRTIADSEFTPCAHSSGFVATDGRCVAASRIGETHHSHIRIFKLDGLMGMDGTWEALVTKAGEEVIGEEGLAFAQKHRIRTGSLRGNATGRAGRVSTIKIRYVVCDGGNGAVHSLVTAQMLAEQTAVLNKAYSGQDTCAGYMAYATSQVDTGFRFTQLPTEYKTNSLCAYDCNTNKYVLAPAVAPREDGVVKVVICDTSILGFASFPGTPDSSRILAVNPGSLPGGFNTYYNLGDTLTHELGHYLGLYHTFHGGCAGGDAISDTAPEAAPYFGCPSSPKSSCPGGLNDPYHNFMDYADDRCMCSFTHDQVEHMWSDLQLWQADLVR
mmetsp:Transcript_45492/g.142629  ORF Transcript_45492/g.142629 Transcript_45492/m.142629 type:complete len:434 (-) Transcript_45492:62-1363(-)